MLGGGDTSAGVLALMLLALAMRRHKAALPLAAVASLGSVVGLGLGYQTGQAGGNLVYRYNAASVYADQNANLVEVQASVSIRDEGRDVDD